MHLGECCRTFYSCQMQRKPEFWEYVSPLCHTFRVTFFSGSNPLIPVLEAVPQRTLVRVELQVHVHGVRKRSRSRSKRAGVELRALIIHDTVKSPQKRPVCRRGGVRVLVLSESLRTCFSQVVQHVETFSFVRADCLISRAHGVHACVIGRSFREECQRLMSFKVKKQTNKQQKPDLSCKITI